MDSAKESKTFSHLDRLLAGFSRSIDAARQLPTPNSEDDEFIRCGMIWFSQILSLDRWNRSHFEYVSLLRDEISGIEFSGHWIRFCCLSTGYFVGMAEAGLID